LRAGGSKSRLPRRLLVAIIAEEGSYWAGIDCFLGVVRWVMGIGVRGGGACGQ
jgi:hypothetical protein